MWSVDRAVGISTLALSLVLLWSGRRKTEFGSLVATLLTISELAGIGLAAWALGWWGLAVLAAINGTALAVWSVILAARVQSKLVYASIQSGEKPDAIKAAVVRMGSRPELRVFGPLERADLICRLAERGRSTAEIELMGIPIAKLIAIHDVDLTWLVERFDQILRLSAEPAENAGEAAAIIHSTSTSSPMTFREAVDAFVAVYSDDLPAEQAS
jgi:hypothetical protein